LTQDRCLVAFLKQKTYNDNAMCGNVISLEVKSPENVKAKSLKLFMSLYKLPYDIRVSAKNFGLRITLKVFRFMACFV